MYQTRDYPINVELRRTHRARRRLALTAVLRRLRPAQRVGRLLKVRG
jgi:hypothetical protein